MNPQEVVTIVDLPEGKTEESKLSFKKMSLNFITKDRALWKKGGKEEKKEKDEKRPDQKLLSSLLEKKASIFGKKPSKSEKSEASPSTEDSLEDGEWTVLHWRSLS